MRRYRPTTLCALIVMLALLLTACPKGSSFATELRLVLAASGPLINSLPLQSGLKPLLIADFSDMAGGAANLGDCLNEASDKAAKLICVSTFSTDVESVIARGHFFNANNPKLQRVLDLIHGIIASAKIYYGAPSARASAKPVTEESIKAQVDALKVEMQVK